VGQCSKTPKVTFRESSQVHHLMNQYLPTQGKIFSAACYHCVTGIPRHRLIQHNLDYSDSLFFCSDTCSWVCWGWSMGHILFSGPSLRYEQSLWFWTLTTVTHPWKFRCGHQASCMTDKKSICGALRPFWGWSGRVSCHSGWTSWPAGSTSIMSVAMWWQSCLTADPLKRFRMAAN